MDKFEWGDVDPSSFVAEDLGYCIDFTFDNTMTNSLNYTSWDYEGHTVQVHHGLALAADTFSVVPLPGWEVVTQNFIVVAEGAKGLITVCQALLG